MTTSTKKRLHLEITGKCNLNCRYCYNSSFNTPIRVEQELTFSEQMTLVTQAIDLGCTSFCFSGGEPFLNPRIMDLMATCPENSRVSILTNGSLISNEIVDHLSGLKQFRELKISLDGFDAHDKIRVGSSHIQVMNVIKCVAEKIPQCKIIVNTMINRYSLGEFLKLYDTLKRLGVSRWRIDMPFNSGRCVENSTDLMDVTFEEIILVYKDMLTMFFKDNKPMVLEMFNVYKSEIQITDVYYKFDDSIHPCAYYNNTITVRPNGDLTYCPSLGFPISNWRSSRSLKQALISAEEHPYNQLTLRQVGKCSGCKYLKLCGGGCRADAITWLGNQYASDPVSCAVMPLVEKYIIPVLPDVERKIYEQLIDHSGSVPESVPGMLDLHI